MNKGLDEILEMLLSSPLVERLNDILNEQRKIGIRVLELLEKNNEPLSSSELAKSLNVSNPRITVLINHLVFLGFAKVKTSKLDARKREITLTKKGKEYLNRSHQKIEVFTRHLENILSAEDIASLRLITRKLQEVK